MNDEQADLGRGGEHAGELSDEGPERVNADFFDEPVPNTAPTASLTERALLFGGE
ncbi:MAG: hypothetical protein AAF416_16095 [Pseudomonadota bacterium]